MDNDDRRVGRILSRREVLVLLGAAGAATLVACAPRQAATATRPAGTASPNAEAATHAAVPACVVKPESTEGPYFVDVQLDRSDIRVEPSTGAAVEGVPLELTFNVAQISGGAYTALPGAVVDVWHCDALGTYSGVAGSVGTKFLRGFQTTAANGLARFTTIYPGWYQGRTVHIHYMIRTSGTGGSAYEFTSQLYFDEGVSAEVFARAPYSAKGQADTPNARDGLYLPEGLLTLAPSGEGYSTQFEIALDLSDVQVGASERAAGRPGG